MNLQVGEEVGFYKNPVSKDLPGWQGPATVTDISPLERGVVSVRWNSKVMEVQTQRIRRCLHFWALLSALDESQKGACSTRASVWMTVSDYASAPGEGQLSNGWCSTFWKTLAPESE